MVEQSVGISRRQSRPVVIVSKDIFYDASLSLEAKGLMGVFCCLEDDCNEVDEAELAEAVGRPLDEVLGLLAELEARGHVATGAAADQIAEDQRRRVEAELADLAKAGQSSDSVTHPKSVVYYLRRGDGAIKIGFSQELTRRLRTLERQFGPLEVLATEPGGWRQEQARHAEFDAARISPDEEWFAAAPALERHVQGLTTVE